MGKQHHPVLGSIVIVSHLALVYPNTSISFRSMAIIGAACPILHNNLGQNPLFISPFTQPINKIGVFMAFSQVAVLFTYTMYLNYLAFLKYYHLGLIVVHPQSFGTNPSEDDSTGRNKQ